MGELSFGMLFSSPITVKEAEDHRAPKTSDGEITIITPENKTYTEPMSGYYPGTYGFENDEIGSRPEEWFIRSDGEPNFEVSVLENVDGRKNVVEINDYNTGSFVGIMQYSYFPRTFGTIEFWARFDSIYDWVSFGALDSTDTFIPLSLRVEGGKWKYRLSGGPVNVPNVIDPKINTWHHVRIDFRCHNAPSYLGISDDRFIAIIDGVSSGELSHWATGQTDYGKFAIDSDPGAIMKTWVDAVGFSWDINYNIGDNLNEGLLLSYNSPINLDLEEYSLDGASNKTILGNTTIPFPNNGLHSVKVNGNRSIINILSTNITGSNNGDPQWVSGKIGTYAIDFDGNGDYFNLDKMLEIGTISHTVSMWVKVPSNIPDDQRVGIMMGNWVSFSSDDYCNWEIYTYGRIRFCWYGNCFLGTSDLRDNTWHLITYVRDKSANKVFVYLDDQIEFILDSAQPDVSLASRPTHRIGQDRRSTLPPVYFNGTIDDIRIFSEAISVQDVEWLYNGGLGREESLTLNQGTYELNWWKFEEGSGNTIYDSYTDIDTTFTYQSDLRYFTVDTTLPSITIISPAENEFFGSIAPDYDISITGFNEAIWYTIDGGTTNITTSGLTGTINQTEWDKLTDGIVTITFYANNSAGIIGSDMVQVIKSVSVEPPPSPPGIPGYNLIALIGVTFAITLILAKRKLKK